MTPSFPRKTLLRGVTVAFFAAWLVGCGGDGESLIPPPQAAGTPALSVSPAAVVFPLNPTTPESIQVSNSGSGTLNVGTVELQGTDAAEFELERDGCSGAALSAGESCELAVAFSPSEAGAADAKNAILQIPSDDPTVAVVDVPLAAGKVAQLTAVPAVVDFGEVVNLATAAADLTVTNEGNTPILIDALSPPTGADAAEFSIVADTCGGVTLALGASCTVELEFAPLLGGDKAATLTLTSTDLTDPLDVALLGTGIGLSFSVDLFSLDFGDVDVGQSSAPVTVTAENISGTEITFDPIQLSGPQAAEFTLGTASTCADAILGAGETCVAVVSCSPVAAGAREAQFDLVAGAESATINLTCNGLGPSVSAPLDHNFAQVSVGTAVSQSFEVANGGNAALEIDTLTLTPATGDFHLVDDNCSGQVVAADGSCAFSVEFAPSTPGSQTAVVKIDTNDFSQPSVSVEVRGFGQASFALTPESADFGDAIIGDFAPLEFTISNLTAAAIDLDALALAGSDPGAFTVPDTPAEPDNCSGISLQPSSSCSVFVRFAPTTVGDKAATLVASSTASGLSVSADLTGRGLALQAAIQVSPPSADFGQQLVGSLSAPQSFQIGNTGQADLVLGSLGVSGPFTIGSDGCSGATIASAGTPCNMEVHFAPTEFGAITGLLTIPSNDPNAPAQGLPVSLAGFGTSSVAVTPRTLGFGPLNVGLSSPTAQTVTVSNRGTDPTTIDSASLTTGTDFVISSDGCSGTSLAAAGTCDVDVVFRPSQAGARADTLTIRAPSSPDVPVDLAGTGLDWLVADVTTVDFGTVTVNRISAARTITVSNAAPTSVPVDSVSTDTGTDFRITGDTCSGTSVQPGASCTIDVVFEPLSFGPKTDAVAVVTPFGEMSVSLLGFGELATPSLAVVPPTMDFGGVIVGQTSAQNTVTLTNSGTEAVTLAAPALGGADAAAFAVASETCTAAPVPGGGSCSVELQFSPLSSGPKTAELTLAGGGETLTVALSGQGLGVAIGITPPAQDFGDVSVGATDLFTFTVTSTGSADLDIGAISVSGAGFALGGSEDCSGALLVPGNTCSLVVAFSPTATGAYSGAVTIPTNILGQPEETVNVSGSGVAAVSVAPAVHNFGSLNVGDTGSQAFVFSNAGLNPVTIAGVSVAGPSVAAFSVPAASNGCAAGTTVAAGATCTFDIQFSPATEGGKVATVTVDSNDAFYPQVSAELAGTGLALTPVSTISPASGFAFGNQGVGLISTPVSFTIRNSGVGDLVLGAGGMSGTAMSQFRIQQDLCSARTLTTGEDCTVEAIFMPTEFGAKAASISFPSNDPAWPGANNPITAPLTGFGVPALTATPRTLGFGSVALGLSSSILVEVSNLGSTPSPVGNIVFQGTSLGQFLLFTDPCSGVELAPGGMCTLDVRYAPTKLGEPGTANHIATMMIPSASGNIDIAVSGVAINPVSVSPPSANVGDVPVGGTVPAGTFTLTNVAGARIGIDDFVSNTDHITILNDSCSNSVLDANATCSFDVDFTPQGFGPQLGEVDLHVNGIHEAVYILINGFGI